LSAARRAYPVTDRLDQIRALVLALIRAVILAMILVGAGGAAADPLPASAPDGSRCTGAFVNPITSTCWECLFPLTIGAAPLFSSGLPDAPNPDNPICACAMSVPPFVRIGLAFGFWEPVRLLDVSRTAWCFPNLGGLRIDPGVGYPSQADDGHSDDDTGGNTHSAYHVHYYLYPLMVWLQLFTDFLCLEGGGFDIAYVTELDPSWNDDEIAALIEPESVLFANAPAQAACALDCVSASTTGFGSNDLFWCAGCQGGMYPQSGALAGEYGQVQGSLWSAERLLYKLHRIGLVSGALGAPALCGLYPMPILDKRAYRLQFTNPSVGASSLAGASGLPFGDYNCPAVGMTTLVSESAKITPAVGQDIGLLVWRKRNCCVF